MISKVCSEDFIMHKATGGNANQFEILAMVSNETQFSPGLIMGVCMCLLLYSERYMPTGAD